MATIIHRRDSECTIDDSGCCIECGLSHTADPCEDCAGRAVHLGEMEGEWPCGWTGEKQAPAKRTPLLQAQDAIARQFGFAEHFEVPGAFFSGSHGGLLNEKPEPYDCTGLTERQTTAAIASYDKLAWSER